MCGCCRADATVCAGRATSKSACIPCPRAKCVDVVVCSIYGAHYAPRNGMLDSALSVSRDRSRQHHSGAEHTARLAQAPYMLSNIAPPRSTIPLWYGRAQRIIESGWDEQLAIAGRRRDTRRSHSRVPAGYTAPTSVDSSAARSTLGWTTW